MVLSDMTVQGRRVGGNAGGAPGICANLDIFIDLGYTAAVLSNSDGDCRPVVEFIRDILTIRSHHETLRRVDTSGPAAPAARAG